MDQFSWSGTDSHTDVYESVDFLCAYYSYVHDHFLQGHALESMDVWIWEVLSALKHSNLQQLMYL